LAQGLIIAYESSSSIGLGPRSVGSMQGSTSQVALNQLLDLHALTPEQLDSMSMSSAAPIAPIAAPIALQPPAKWPKDLQSYLQYGINLEGLVAMANLNAEVPSPLPAESSKIYEHTKYSDCSCKKQGKVCGYANVERIKETCKRENDGRSVCERFHAEGSHYVGKATVFMSWWLGSSLEDVISALRRYLQQNNLDKDQTFFWVCDYCFRQTKLLRDDTPLPDKMKGVISALGRVVILLDPWHEPAPLKRSWCLWEVYVACSEKAVFDVVMSDAQGRAFANAMLEDFGSIHDALGNVDVRLAKAYKEEDQRMVMERVETSMGASALNQMVTDALNKWLSEEVRKWVIVWKFITSAHGEYPPVASLALAQSIGNMLIRSQMYGEAEPFYRHSLFYHEAFLPTSPRSDPTALKLTLNYTTVRRTLGMILKNAGKLEEAERLLRKNLTYMEEVLPERSETLDTVVTLADVLKRLDKDEEAAELYHRALSWMDEKAGAEDTGMLALLTSYGGLLLKHGQFEVAEEVYRRALFGREKLFGPMNIETVKSVMNLGIALSNLDKLDEAETFMSRALLGSRQLLGDKNQGTIRCFDNYAGLLVKMERFEEAEQAFRRVVSDSEEVMGAMHSTTQHARHGLVVCLARMGKEEEALTMWDVMQNPQAFMRMVNEEAVSGGIGGGGMGGGGGSEMAAAAAERARDPEMLQRMVADLLPQIEQSDPASAEAIRAHPQLLLDMLQDGMQPGTGGGEGGGVIILTDEENESVERLTALGFDRQTAFDAYIFCGKNDELAANFLFD